MTIKKPVKAPIDTTKHFISAAPDSTPEKKAGVIRGKKEVITVGFSPALLERIEHAAADVGISRAAWINLACSKLLAGD